MRSEFAFFIITFMHNIERTILFHIFLLIKAELLRLVKHLERMRNDYYSTLRDTEWKLDKESKVSIHDKDYVCNILCEHLHAHPLSLSSSCFLSYNLLQKTCLFSFLKEFHHYDEMRRVYKADLKHANQTIERMRISQVLDPNGVVSPFYPSGYFR